MEVLPQAIYAPHPVPCGICGAIACQKVVAIDAAPAVLGCALPGRDDVFVSFNVYCCASCGFISTDADPEAMAYDRLHSEALGPTWERHHADFAAFCQNFMPANAVVLEIGPSSNPMIRRLTTPVEEAIYIDMIDSVPFNLAANEQFITGAFPIPGFERRFDAVIASHVFEHAPNIDAFLSSSLESLRDGGSVLISIPDFETWISNRYWNAVTPEHTSYPFRSHLGDLAERHSCLLQVESHRGHSVFARFSRGVVTLATPPQRGEYARELLLSWAETMRTSVTDAEKKLDAFLAKDTVDAICIAGASHLAQYPVLMSETLQRQTLFVIDNSTIKQGRRLYGTDLTVRGFSNLGSFRRPLVILFNSPYRAEMARQVLAINKDAILVEPS